MDFSLASGISLQMFGYEMGRVNLMFDTPTTNALCVTYWNGLIPSELPISSHPPQGPPFPLLWARTHTKRTEVSAGLAVHGGVAVFIVKGALAHQQSERSLTRH